MGGESQLSFTAGPAHAALGGAEETAAAARADRSRVKDTYVILVHLAICIPRPASTLRTPYASPPAVR